MLSSSNSNLSSSNFKIIKKTFNPNSGLWVWIEFNNRNACIRSKKHEGLARYFHSLVPVSKHFVVDDRVVWIGIEGLPLCAWSASAFTKIAATLGKVMFINNDEENALSIRRVCLKLPMGKKVDENMLVTIEGVKYKIWIKEIGVWRPSIIKLNDTDTSESDSKDDDGSFVSSANEEHSEDEVKTDDQKDPLGVHSHELPKPDNKNDANMDDKTNDVSVEGRNSNVLNMQQEEEQKRDTNDCVEQTRESTPSRPPGFEDIPIDTYVSLNSKVKSILRTSYSASSDKNQSCDSLGGKSHVSDSYSQNINNERYIKVGLKLGHDFNGCQQALNATGRMGEMNMSMNILSINACGIGDIVKRRRIANICSRHNVSFLGIQESIVTSTDLFTLKSLWGNFTFDFAVSSARGMSGGIISLWDLAAFVKSKVISFDHMLIVQGNYIIFGDFNAVREESERRGCNFIQREADDFNTFISSNHLVDVLMGGVRFYEIELECFDNGPKPFRFLNSWLDEPGFSDILSVAWEHTPHGHTLKAIHFKNKLKGLKGHLRSWCSGHLKSQILSKQDLLEKLKVIDHLIDLGIATSSDIEDRNQLKSKIYDIDKKEMADMAQKAKIKWSIKGDENSKYYHGILNKKRYSLAIKGIKHEGMWITEASQLLALRLARVVDTVVSVEQTVFIKGHQILDGPLLVNELVDWYKKKKKKMMILKINFEKAFDSISWDYLDNISLVLINGSPTQEFMLHRGLQQGDPLSPFFIIAMEGLHVAMEDAKASNLYCGISLRMGGRSMLLKTVLGSLGIYFLFMFVMPVGVAKQLESMRSHFFWGRNSDQRKMARVSWDSVMASYSRGGLNIGSLVCVIKHIYGQQRGFESSPSRMTGNGASNRFWEDLWLDNQLLSSHFPRLYALENFKNVAISDQWNGVAWFWQ
ncbi:RNA-directed DNA polymerase, eukaryota, reverse transcriptase zinc-binding domain protein [Tanacetum coccineum]